MADEQLKYRRDVFCVICLAIVAIVALLVTAMLLGIDGKGLAAGVGMIGALAGGFGGFTVKHFLGS